MKLHEEIKQSSASSWPTGEGQEKDDHVSGIGAAAKIALEGAQEAVGVMSTRPNFVNLIGRRFGRLMVIRYVRRIKWGDSYWECQCDCGAIKSILGSNMIRGKSTSCGCYHRERMGIALIKHGARYTAEYSVWLSIKTRCLKPSYKEFKYYGGRGIKVCDLWLNSFDAFLADMGLKPSPQHSIDRFPDNNGNYEPGNCKWATAEEQANNRRTTRIITHNGLSMSIRQWERNLNAPRGTLLRRLKMGMPVATAISTPIHRRPMRRREG